VLVQGCTLTFTFSAISSESEKVVEYFLFLKLLSRVWHTVTELLELLRYKDGFDSRYCHWNYSLTSSFRQQHGPGFDSASNRNEYQEHFLGVKADGA